MSGIYGGTSRRFTPDETAEAARLYVLEEKSLGEVGEILGRDRTSVRVALVRVGVKLRDQNFAYRRWLDNRKAAEIAAVAKVLG